jgi:hypothetical protein
MAFVMGAIQRSTFNNVSLTAHSTLTQVEFKHALIERYQARIPGCPTLLRCMVTGLPITQQFCIAGHIVPRARHHLLSVYRIPGMNDINDVRNGILWADSIEKAYTANKVCIVYDPFSSKLVFVVLDATYLARKLRVKGKTFAFVHGKELVINARVMPSLRLLLNQATFAHELAISENWPRPSNHEAYAQMLSHSRDFLLSTFGRDIDSGEFMQPDEHSEIASDYASDSASDSDHLL